MNEWLGQESGRQNLDEPTGGHAKTVVIAALAASAAIMVWQILADPSGFLNFLQYLGDVILLPLLAFGLYRTMITFTRERPVSEAEHTISIGTKAIVHIIDNSSTEIPWDDVSDIRLSDLAIVLMTEHHVDLIVPRRAFATALEAIAFYRAAVQYWQPPLASSDIIDVDPAVWPPPPAAAG